MKAHSLSEADLSLAFEDALTNGAWSRRYPKFVHYTRELDCQQGRPDFVASPQRTGRLRKIQRERLASALHNPSMARLVSLLKRNAPRTEPFLRRTTGLTHPVVRRSLTALQSLGFVTRTPSDAFVLSPQFPAIDWELWAFELKLEDWQRALYQALQYRAFAHRVAVVFPERWAHRLEARAQTFRKLSVGAIALNEDNGAIRFIVRPTKSQPASRFHHLYALGRFLATTTNTAANGLG